MNIATWICIVGGLICFVGAKAKKDQWDKEVFV